MRAFAPLPKEPKKAFSYYEEYRDLGPTRTIRRLAQKIGRDEGYLQQLSMRWEWVARANERDAMFGDVRQQAIREYEMERAVAGLRREDEVAEEVAQTRVAAAKTARQMGNWPIARTVKEYRDESGNHTVILEPQKWRFMDMVRLAQFAIDAEPATIEKAARQLRERREALDLRELSEAEKLQLDEYLERVFPEE